MSYSVYALESLKDGHLYIGMTSNLTRRLREHNSKKTPSTRHRVPFKILYAKEFSTGQEAREYEKYLKSGSGREFLKSL